MVRPDFRSKSVYYYQLISYTRGDYARRPFAPRGIHTHCGRARVRREAERARTGMFFYWLNRASGIFLKRARNIANNMIMLNFSLPLGHFRRRAVFTHEHTHTHTHSHSTRTRENVTCFSNSCGRHRPWKKDDLPNAHPSGGALTAVSNRGRPAATRISFILAVVSPPLRRSHPYPVHRCTTRTRARTHVRRHTNTLSSLRAPPPPPPVIHNSYIIIITIILYCVVLIHTRAFVVRCSSYAHARNVYQQVHICYTRFSRITYNAAAGVYRRTGIWLTGPLTFSHSRRVRPVHETRPAIDWLRRSINSRSTRRSSCYYNNKKLLYSTCVAGTR